VTSAAGFPQSLAHSNEELEARNAHLTALCRQLEESLERQRTISDDLRNILYSTEIATLFLDDALKVRFFTPATSLLFDLVEGDIGRPSADIHSLAADDSFSDDARAVLLLFLPQEREVEALGKSWCRRIVPYRSHDEVVEGVVITFTDITERKHTSGALEAATHHAEIASVAKSRFLAAASHDLRQPLQTLALLQGLLAKAVQGAGPQDLVGRFGDTLKTMSDILNALLDINQIEAGIVRPDVIAFPIDDLLNRLRSEFTYHALSRKLSLRVVSCSRIVRSDPRLLEQMLRNLLANALKYTTEGKVLIGCRRRGDRLSVQVWDTGVGIAQHEQQAIFREYHQIDNPARERNRGLGLGLSIVDRLAALLGHTLEVSSEPGRGSAFSIDVPIAGRQPGVGAAAVTQGDPGLAAPPRAGVVLVVEDDLEVRELLKLALEREGHQVAAAADGAEALSFLDDETFSPELILADFNLPNGIDGLQLVEQLRLRILPDVPVVILTGDISTATLREIADDNCTQLNKPVNLVELTDTVQRLLPSRSRLEPALVTGADAPSLQGPVIFVVDDDRDVREAIRSVLEEDGHRVETFATGEAFLEAFPPGIEACLLVDAYLPGMDGLEILHELNSAGQLPPTIMITGQSDVGMAVAAMKAGAGDFVEKPVTRGDLLAGVTRALEQARSSNKLSAERETAANQVANLTSRQREIMNLVLAGHPSKNIAADLGISQRTVENHRASIMRRTGSDSLPALARLAVAADWSEPSTPDP
jgi:two-component system CheB/CheR fusion protein